ncbi:hypothetical protein [Salinimonas chungwhensis]|uniref:hypothetical protein n=1 Tax=Salinimonas chungwhensis TaxID=265425 RepID=UPI00037DBAF2|nr:hypothetical protein [Salinimonas chungwhensis]
MKVLVLLASLLVAVQANAAIMSLSVPGSASGILSSESGWLSGDTSAIDFYTFELSSDTDLSFSLNTAFTSMGMSLYAGEIMMDPGFLFNNGADFFDFAGESLTYLTGTDSFLPGAGNNELDAGIVGSGFYTLAVGGNEGFSLGAFDYTLNATAVSANVAEPSTFGIVLIMLAGLFWARRYQG